WRAALAAVRAQTQILNRLFHSLKRGSSTGPFLQRTGPHRAVSLSGWHAILVACRGVRRASMPSYNLARSATMEIRHSPSQKLFSIALFSAVAAISACAQSIPTPPLSQAVPVINTMYGVQVSDPYQWLEDGSSANTRAWIAAQQQYTANLLSSRPGIEALRAQTRELVDLEETRRVICRKERCFIEKKPAGKQKASIFVRAGSSGEDRLFIDAS